MCPGLIEARGIAPISHGYHSPVVLSGVCAPASLKRVAKYFSANRAAWMCIIRGMCPGLIEAFERRAAHPLAIISIIRGMCPGLIEAHLSLLYERPDTEVLSGVCAPASLKPLCAGSERRGGGRYYPGYVPRPH